MRYKKYIGTTAEYNNTIKNYKAVPGISGVHINISATEFITQDKIYLIPINGKYSECKIEWTVHYINPHSGKNKGMKMIRIRGKQYGLSYIMASTYIENPYCLKRVIHKDGNHNNYHANNLAWR